MRSRNIGLIILFLTALTLTSCEKKNTTIRKLDVLTLPSVTGKDLTTVYTDSGKIQMELVARLMESYTRTDAPYTEFKDGIKVYFYQGHDKPVASVAAHYAKYTDSNALWELQDSVVAINEEGEKLETDLLYWDQKKNFIYTDRFVKITTADQIIQGYGLESDTRLVKRKIKNLSAVIYIPDDQKTQQNP
jgi:LPS export ABC transporter protein LptC